jgi:hypothetical protein
VDAKLGQVPTLQHGNAVGHTHGAEAMADQQRAGQLALEIPNLQDADDGAQELMQSL